MNFGRTPVNQFQKLQKRHRLHDFYASKLFWGIIGGISLTLHGAIAVVFLAKIIRLDSPPAGEFIAVELMSLPTANPNTKASEVIEPASQVPPQQAPAPTQDDTTGAIASPPVPERPNPLIPKIPKSTSTTTPPPQKNTTTPPPDKPPGTTQGGETNRPPSTNPSTQTDPDRPTTKPSSTSPPGTTQPPPVAPTGNGSGSPSALAVNITALELTRTDIDIPDQLAEPLQNNQQLEAIAYLESPNIKLLNTVVITVELIINQQGKLDEILSAKASPGTISEAEAKQLATKILTRWQFSPSYMGGQPVFQAYRLNLNIKPIFSP
jgi:outer membrane biosynthesis protein TonB